MSKFFKIFIQSISITLSLSISIILSHSHNGNTQEIDTFLVDKYIKNIGSTDIKIRDNAISSLLHLNGLAIPGLIDHLDSFDSVERHNSELILNKIIKDSNLLHNMIKVSKSIQKEKVLPLINKDLNSESKGLRLISVFILGRVTFLKKELIPELFNTFKHEDEDVRDISEKFIASIGDPVVPRLLIALKDKNERVHNSAVQSFVNMGENKTDFLLNLFEEKNENIRIGAVSALEQIIQIKYASRNKVVSKNASEQNKITKEKYKFISAFTQALKDKNSEVRQKSAYALSIFGADAKLAIPNLLEALRLSNNNFLEDTAISGAFIKIGDSAIPPLIKALENPNEFIRSGAVDSLGKILRYKKYDFVPIISKLLKDKKVKVRLSTVNALGDIGYKSKSTIAVLNDL